MDSQFFNRKRFIALCRWDWTERQKALGLQAVVIYAILTVFSGFYTIRGALRANALSHYVSPQRVEEWKAISADLAQGVDGSWTSVSALFFPILVVFLIGTARRTQRALQATSQAARTLTFPVSAFEQFLLRWLYAVPLALLTYCAVFVAADFTRVGLCSLIVPQVDYAHLLPYADYWDGRVHPYWLLTLLNLMLWAQSVFICTSETKRASVRTAVLLLVVLVPFALAHSRYALGEAFNLSLMSNPPNIKLMNRSCFDRKRFAVLLHEDWAARRTRCLVTLAAGYLLLSAILTVSCLKAYSENATLLQTVPTDILEDKFAHLTDTATNQNAAIVTVTAFFFLFLIVTPWLWNAPIYNKGQHIRYLLLPTSTFEKFARWWLYAVPLSILAGVLIILAADITRVIICNMAFPDYSFARPLLFTSGLHTASSGFVLRMLLTTSLLGQAISARSETGRTPLHRTLGKCPILLLPLLLIIGVSLIAEGDPYTYPQQPGAATAEVVWHTFWLAVTSLFWLSAYRRMKKNDLKYQYALNPKSV